MTTLINKNNLLKFSNYNSFICRSTSNDIFKRVKAYIVYWSIMSAKFSLQLCCFCVPDVDKAITWAWTDQCFISTYVTFDEVLLKVMLMGSVVLLKSHPSKNKWTHIPFPNRLVKWVWNKSLCWFWQSDPTYRVLMAQKLEFFGISWNKIPSFDRVVDSSIKRIWFWNLNGCYLIVKFDAINWLFLS